MPYVIAALAFGLSAVLNPGPFTALVLAETLAGGVRRGMQAALAPLFTDSVMIVAALALVAQLPARTLAGVQAVGGLVLLYMGYHTAQGAGTASFEAAAVTAAGGGDWGPLRRAVAVNILNPNAWLFWLTAGAPTLRLALNAAVPAAVLFVAVFFICLVGGTLLLVLAAAGGRHLLRGRTLRLLLGLMGAVLALLGVQALWLGLRGLAA